MVSRLGGFSMKKTACFIIRLIKKHPPGKILNKGNFTELENNPQHQKNINRNSLISNIYPNWGISEGNPTLIK